MKNTMLWPSAATISARTIATDHHRAYSLDRACCVAGEKDLVAYLCFNPIILFMQEVVSLYVRTMGIMMCE